MFRDTKEELQRLEAQLLQEETPEESVDEPQEAPQQEDDALIYDVLNKKLHTSEDADDPEVEEDILEEDEVRHQSNILLTAVIIVLLCAIAVVVGAIFLKLGGFL